MTAAGAKAGRIYRHRFASHPQGRQQALFSMTGWLIVSVAMGWAAAMAIETGLRLFGLDVMGHQLSAITGGAFVASGSFLALLAVLVGLRGAGALAMRRRTIEVHPSALVLRDDARVLRSLRWSGIRSIRSVTNFPYSTVVRGRCGRLEFDVDCTAEDARIEDPLPCGLPPRDPDAPVFDLLLQVACRSQKPMRVARRETVVASTVAVALLLVPVGGTVLFRGLVRVLDLAASSRPSCAEATSSLDRWRPLLGRLALFQASASNVLRRCGRADDALEAARRAVRLDPSLDLAHAEHSASLEARGDLRGAWLAWIPGRVGLREGLLIDDTRALAILRRASFALRRLERRPLVTAKGQLAWAQAEVAAGQPADALERLDVPSPDWRTHLARAAAWRCLGDERAVEGELAALRASAADAPAAVRNSADALANHLATGLGPAELDGLAAWLRWEHRLLEAMLRCGGEAEVSLGAPSPN